MRNARLILLVLSMLLLSAGAAAATATRSDGGRARDGAGQECNKQPSGSVPGNPKRFLLNARGSAKQMPSGTARLGKYVVSMYSLSTGGQVGSVTHDNGVALAGPGPVGVIELVTTFSFAEGNLVSRMVESANGDPDRPGWFLTGAHPTTRTIDPKASTGAFRGSTGKVQMAGQHDGTRLAAESIATLNDFYVIVLDQLPRRCAAR